MSDEPTAVAPAADVASSTPPESAKAQDATAPAPLEGPSIEALQALQAELAAAQAQNEELKPLAEAARAAEEANKSELQKLQELQAKREKENADLRAENTRLSLAQTYGLAPEDLGLLGSGDAAQMEANAKHIQALREAAAKAPEPTPSARPVDAMRSGASAKKPADDISYPAHWAS